MTLTAECVSYRFPMSAVSVTTHTWVTVTTMMDDSNHGQKWKWNHDNSWWRWKNQWVMGFCSLTPTGAHIDKFLGVMKVLKNTFCLRIMVNLLEYTSIFMTFEWVSTVKSWSSW